MQMMISLSMVQVGVLAFLACLCASIFTALRNHSSLAWLAAALACGAVGGLLLGQARGSMLEWLMLTIVVPAAYICLAQAVRVLLGQQGQYRALLVIILVLTCIAVLLAVSGVAFLYQTLPFQLACALAVSESIVRLMRVPQRSVLDICLVATLAALAAIFLVRIPVYLILFEPGAHYAAIRVSSFQHSSLAIAGALAPISAFLLLVKIIGGVISTYRMRSERDGLTGLLNRHGFDLAVANKGRGSGAVILCDIDHFKGVNDRYGHAVGDDVLCAFAGMLAHTGHCVGRMGGEEFGLLLPLRSAADAAGIAEMIRQRFYAGAFPGIDPDHRLSASFGIAEYGLDRQPKNAFVRADAALYRAKETGRNRVTIAEEDARLGTDPRLRAA
jgi:diguanylate cyclase (GGDEF)-like protein